MSERRSKILGASLRRRLFVASVLASAVAVAAFTVNAVLLRHPLAFVGYLQPRTVTELNFSAQAPITQVYVRPGDVVQQGEVVARQDTTAMQAKLLADQAQLSADQAAVQAAQGPSQPNQLQSFQAKVALAQAQLAAAQAKAADTAAADASSIATDSNYVTALQQTATSDQATAQELSGSCSSPSSTGSAGATSAAALRSPTAVPVRAAHATTTTTTTKTSATTIVYPVTVTTAPISVPSPTTPTIPLPTLPPGSSTGGGSSVAAECVQASHQVAADAASLTQAQGALQVAEANARLDQDTLAGDITVAAAQIAVAQADETAGAAASTPAALAQLEANVAKDNAQVAADQVSMAGAVLTAPSNGIIASVGGVVGDVASPDGIKFFTTAEPLPTPQSSGINLFPQAPQQQAQQSTPYKSAITLDSFAMKIVVQVPEDDIKALKVNQVARATVPAAPKTKIVAYVERVEPEPIDQNGQVYYLIDLGLRPDTKLVQPGGIETIAAVSSAGSEPKGYFSGLTVDVDL